MVTKVIIMSYKRDWNTTVKRDQANAIRPYLLANIPSHPNDIVAVAAQYFNTTRTTIHRHLNHLLRQHLISKSGTTKAITYHLKSKQTKQARFKLHQTFDEFIVWRDEFSQLLSGLSQNIYDICEYGFTEMVNNAKDHSNGSWVEILVKLQAKNLIITVLDNGIGIFDKLKQYFNLTQSRESILEISKGKVTTQPNEHSGEGIFFTSRAFDTFKIEANKIAYLRDNVEKDWFISKNEDLKKGTKITMEVGLSATQQLRKIFETYQNSESLAFNKTEITVALSKLEGERYISRSQAKRILRGLEKFEIIIFDFKDVTTVGQGFVDEVFRVYQQQHPHTKIKYVRANDDVLFMIKRGLA